MPPPQQPQWSEVRGEAHHPSVCMSAHPSSTAVPPAWREPLSDFDLALRRQVAMAVDAAAEPLSDRFYDHMLADDRTAGMLDHGVVNQRLHASMARWLRTLFATDTPLDRMVAMHQRTGEVHARIGVPMDLVAQGARVLKREIVSRLSRSTLSRERLTDAIQYVYEMIDLAIDTMNAAYSSNANRMARSDEAYRLFFLNQDMKAERERQKSRLLEWAHEILVGGYWNVDAAGVAAASPQGSSPFGLWLQHKASILFEGAGELDRIHACMRSIEDEWLPQLRRARDERTDAREIVTQMNLRIDEIKQLLASMFDRYIEAEDGRDSVTRLLNRRYFPSVAKREIALAQRGHGGFALLAVEIDHFDRVREAVGADGADGVLSDVADTLLDSVRAGDFVFRIGDARFLVMLVETSTAALSAVADGLRRQIESMRARAPGRGGLSITSCIGAALFDGHPDYQRLLDRAEAALREAQSRGINGCWLDA